jgi:hypothetical protein
VIAVFARSEATRRSRGREALYDSGIAVSVFGRLAMTVV